MDITFVTSAASDLEAMHLLSELGLPFKKKSSEENKPVVSQKPPVAEEAPVVEEAPVAEEAPVVEEAPDEKIDDNAEDESKEVNKE